MGFLVFILSGIIVAMVVLRSEAGKPRTFMGGKGAKPKDVPPHRKKR